MSVHASAQLAWIRRTLEVWFGALTVYGSPAFVYENTGRGARLTSNWIRMSLRPVGQTHMGRSPVDTTKVATSQSLMVVMDLWWPNGDYSATHGLESLERAASDLIEAAELPAACPLYDYTDPNTPVLSVRRDQPRGPDHVTRTSVPVSFRRRMGSATGHPDQSNGSH